MFPRDVISSPTSSCFSLSVSAERRRRLQLRPLLLPAGAPAPLGRSGSTRLALRPPHLRGPAHCPAGAPPAGGLRPRGRVLQRRLPVRKQTDRQTSQEQSVSQSVRQTDRCSDRQTDVHLLLQIKLCCCFSALCFQSDSGGEPARGSLLPELPADSAEHRGPLAAAAGRGRALGRRRRLLRHPARQRHGGRRLLRLPGRFITAVSFKTRPPHNISTKE